MKVKTILLNAIVSIPSEAGEEKIQKATSKEIKPDKNKTPNRQWFLEQNLVPPDDSEDEVEVDEFGNVFLDEEDFEEVTVPLFLPIDNIGSFVGTVEGNTRIYTKSNIAYDVIEDAFEIDDIIEYLNMSWWEKRVSSFNSFWRRIKYKMKGKKEVNLQEVLSRPENQPEYKQ